MLHLSHVCKSFVGQPAPILQDIELTLEPGSFCVLVGSNGSGKSTLLRIVTGECPPDTGQIFLAGHEVTTWSLAARSRFFSSVTQDVRQGTVGPMTLLENIVLSLLRGHPSRLRFTTRHEAHVRTLLEESDTGLERYLHTPVDVLSGGQRQTLATLMALLSAPSLLLLDEHTSALDPPAQKALMEQTARLVTQHAMTTLLITHRLEDALHYGDRLLFLQQGRIVLDAQGSAKQALTLEQLLAQFGGNPFFPLPEAGAL